MPRIAERASRVHRARRLAQSHGRQSPSLGSAPSMDYDLKDQIDQPPMATVPIETVKPEPHVVAQTPASSKRVRSKTGSPDTMTASLSLEESRHTLEDDDEDMPMDEFMSMKSSPPGTVTSMAATIGYSSTNSSIKAGSNSSSVKTNTTPSMKQPPVVVTPPPPAAIVEFEAPPPKGIPSMVSGSSPQALNRHVVIEEPPQINKTTSTQNEEGFFGLYKYSRTVSSSKPAKKKNERNSPSDSKKASSTLSRMVSAIRNKSGKRPEGLTQDQLVLWDAIQTALQTQQSNGLAKRRMTEQQLADSTAELDQCRLDIQDLEEGLELAAGEITLMKAEVDAVRQQTAIESQVEKEELQAMVQNLEKKLEAVITESDAIQDGHGKEIRSIRRVLADSTDDREKDRTQFLDQIKSLEKENKSLMESRNLFEEDDDSLRAKAQQALDMKPEMEKLKNTISDLTGGQEKLSEELEQKGGRIVELEQELESALTALRVEQQKLEDHRRQIGEQVVIQSDITSTVVESKKAMRRLEEELEHKQTELNNAKRTIAALETKQTSIKNDVTGKLKEKERELLALREESSDRKKMVDNLTSELEDVRIAKRELEQGAGQWRMNQKQLKRDLKAAVDELQSAAVVLETVGDDSIVEEISTIMVSSIQCLKSCLRNTKSEKNIDVYHGTDGSAPPPPPPLHADDVKEALQQKDTSLKLLEVSLRKTEGEIVLLKLQNERLKLDKDQHEEMMQGEMRHMQEESKANMELVTKKDRELQELRNSLDDSREDSFALEGDAAPASAEDITRLKRSFITMKEEHDAAARELQQEKDSLFNAKMIISSLEKANKTMREDLKSKLAESNSAISSLMEKSMDSEFKSKKVSEELENVRKEKKRSEAALEKEIEKLKDASLSTALKLASKEHEIMALKETSGRKKVDP